MKIYLKDLSIQTARVLRDLDHKYWSNRDPREFIYPRYIDIALLKKSPKGDWMYLNEDLHSRTQ